MEYKKIEEEIPGFDLVIVPEEGLGTGRFGVFSLVIPFLFELPKMSKTIHYTKTTMANVVHKKVKYFLFFLLECNIIH